MTCVGSENAKGDLGPRTTGEPETERRIFEILPSAPALVVEIRSTWARRLERRNKRECGALGHFLVFGRELRLEDPRLSSPGRRGGELDSWAERNRQIAANDETWPDERGKPVSDRHTREDRPARGRRARASSRQAEVE